MMEVSKTKQLVFLDKGFAEAYEKLRLGSVAEKRLYLFISHALELLKRTYASGTKFSAERIQKAYSQFKVQELWVLDMPPDWRIYYTVVGDEIQVIDMTCDGEFQSSIAMPRK